MPFKVGIDSYCFHRYFAAPGAGQAAPAPRWTTEDLLRFAFDLGVEGISFESIYLPALDAGFMRELSQRLDERGVARVLAWGHPNGLEGGLNLEALDDLKRHIPMARALGTTVMRIVASSRHFRAHPHDAQIERLSVMLKDACRVAADHGVYLAAENHLDFTADEWLAILEKVDSPWLKITFDSGNALRVFDEPVAAARKLGPHVMATHIKDVTTIRRATISPLEPYFWPSVPPGQGLVDLPGVVAALRQAGYQGFLAMEIDFVAEELRPLGEEELVRQGVQYLRSIA